MVQMDGRKQRKDKKNTHNHMWFFQPSNTHLCCFLCDNIIGHVRSWGSGKKNCFFFSWTPTLNLHPKEAAFLRNSDTPFAIHLIPPPPPPRPHPVSSSRLLLPTAHHVPDKHSADSTPAAVSQTDELPLCLSHTQV